MKLHSLITFYYLCFLKLVVHPFWILLVCSYPLGQSDYSAFTVHHELKVSPSARCFCCQCSL
jgi:hypothetical protein